MIELNQADQTLHSLAQLIALTAMQWLPSRADIPSTLSPLPGKRCMSARPVCPIGRIGGR